MAPAYLADIMGTLRYVTLFAVALVTGLVFAHVLEMPMKMAVPAELWTTFQHTLYRWFALVGGPLEVAAVGLSAVWAVLDARRRQPGRGWAIAGAAATAIALVLWAVVVQSANAQIGGWTPGAEPADWGRWRAQWELGHTFHFALLALGFACLLGSALRAERLRR